MPTPAALTGDFRGDTAAVDTVLAARPDVFAHNLETVPRLSRAVRVQATEVLYAAPCDLDRAAALVATDGAALAGHRAGKPPVQDQQPGGVGP